MKTMSEIESSEIIEYSVDYLTFAFVNISQCHFPSSVLRPGQEYSNDIVYKFGVQLANYM